MDALRHAFQAAADQDGRALADPFAQFRARVRQQKGNGKGRRKGKGKGKPSAAGADTGEEEF